jgi:eukaryotic-like serine/threonine-protein kinase
MAQSSSAESDPLVGSMLGKDYRVLERIGMGGMAVVYLVEHQTLLKRFAAKVLSNQHTSNPEARARFTQEAHAASQLDHENIVSISDFGVTVDGRPYFVMELLRGLTLADRLEEGRMTLEEVVAVAVPVARALAHAHAEGIIHRDVKPENIFLVQRSQGRWGVKVLDFGIARLPVNDRMTKTGEALGSPMYMSPEACRGEEVDPRSDIYSFGIVLYLMLAGRVPFSDENLLKVLQMQVSSPLPLPTSFNPDLPPDLELVIIRALAKDVSERYETMDEFLFALEAALPDGSDALLIQAQFGTSTTPFPGTLERVRNSARMSSQPPFSGELMRSASNPNLRSLSGSNPSLRTPSASNPNVRAVSLPTAPKRRGVFVAGALLVIAAAGGGYAWLRYSSQGPVAADKQVAVAVAQPTTTTAAPVVTAAHAAPPTEAAQPPPAPVEAPPPAEIAAAPPATAAKPINTSPQNRFTGRQVPRGTVRPTAGNKKMAAGSATVTQDPSPPPIETPAVVDTPPKSVEAPPAPAPAPTPPVATAPTNPAPVPAPAPIKPAPVVPIGSMDATPTIVNLDVNGPLPNSVVRRGVERVLPAVRACYRAAATSQKKTPMVKVMLRFEIDENSAATNVSAGASFGSLSSCVAGAVGQVQTQQAPDVGTAQVALTIQFTPI